MSLLNVIFIFGIIKKNIVSVCENVTSTKLKFNFFQGFNHDLICISQHFSVKTLSNISIKNSELLRAFFSKVKE